MGSTPAQGNAPWVCRPFTTRLKVSPAAMRPFGLKEIEPASSGVTPTCRPNIASTFGLSRTPSLTITSAPPGSPGTPSSAGWKTIFTVPARSAFIPASTSAAPRSIAMWKSWPQACMTPTSRPLYSPRSFEAKGSPVSSVTGSASMSDRSATTGPGLPPTRSPTTPVFATPVRTS